MDQQQPARPAPDTGVDARTRAFLTEEMFLRRVLRSRLPDADAVDEVLQEVAVALTTAADVPLEAIQPWLCRVAIRQSLLFHRRRSRQRSLHADYSATAANMEGSVSGGDPLLWMLAVERRQRLQTALSRLRPHDEEILTMKYVEGLNYHQIAGWLSVTEHAVANRLRAARQRLRAELEQALPDETTEPRRRSHD